LRRQTAQQEPCQSVRSWVLSPPDGAPTADTASPHRSSMAKDCKILDDKGAVAHDGAAGPSASTRFAMTLS